MIFDPAVAMIFDPAVATIFDPAIATIFDLAIAMIFDPAVVMIFDLADNDKFDHAVVKEIRPDSSTPRSQHFDDFSDRGSPREKIPKLSLPQL
jgi:hypothetical protein